MLESIASRHFSTKTPWTDTASEFEGPTVRALLNYVGAKSDSFHLVAHDDYRVQVTGIDFDKYPAIFALKQNGKYMSLRNKGPAWLLFPWDDYPELHSEVNSSMSVWQLKEMVVD
jgi:hypothetical protein